MRALILMMTLISFQAAVADDPKTPAKEEPGKHEPAQGEKKDAAGGPATTQPARTVTAETAKSPLDFTMTDIDGRPVDLAKYKGQVLLIVNVASQCGLTPQYEQLQALADKYRDRGLRIAAFPANDFKQQEPGSSEQIKEFCTSKYHVTFDLFAKIAVKGDEQAELYKYLTSKDKNGERGGEIQWNFTKFLVGRDGRVVARFEPKTKPDDAQVVAAIEKALDESAPARP